jgi:Tol biopolymer transport system component
VVFASVSSNLVAGDTPSTQDLFLVDTAGASRSITDITPAANHSPGSYQVTCDGNYVIYDSSASNLVSGDTDGHVDVFKYSIADGTTQLISTDASGNQYAAAACETSTPSCPYLGSVGNPSISMDGRYVAMNYVKEVTLGINNYFYGSLWIKDTVTGTLSEASQTTDGSSTDNSIYPTISADGREMYYLHQTDTGQPNRLYVATDYL